MEEGNFSSVIRGTSMIVLAALVVSVDNFVVGSGIKLMISAFLVSVNLLYQHVTCMDSTAMKRARLCDVL